jgi:hypothetical protein
MIIQVVDILRYCDFTPPPPPPHTHTTNPYNIIHGTISSSSLYLDPN